MIQFDEHIVQRGWFNHRLEVFDDFSPPAIKKNQLRLCPQERDDSKRHPQWSQSAEAASAWVSWYPWEGGSEKTKKQGEISIMGHQMGISKNRGKTPNHPSIVLKTPLFLETPKSKKWRKNWVVATQIFFIFHPETWKWNPFWGLHIFQRGWFNHQLDEKKSVKLVATNRGQGLPIGNAGLAVVGGFLDLLFKVIFCGFYHGKSPWKATLWENITFSKHRKSKSKIKLPILNLMQMYGNFEGVPLSHFSELFGLVKLWGSVEVVSHILTVRGPGRFP